MTHPQFIGGGRPALPSVPILSRIAPVSSAAPGHHPMPVKPLLVVEGTMGPQRTEEVIRRGLEAGCEVMVVAAEADGPAIALPATPAVHQKSVAGKATRASRIRRAAEAGAPLGFTHLITLDRQYGGETELDRIVAQIDAGPQAVVCGVRSRGAPPAELRVGIRRRLANFWFRLQTGIRVTESAGGLRAYPLEVVQTLRTLSRDAGFDYEMLVRAAWAGAVIREVPVAAADPLPGGHRSTRLRRMRDWLFWVGLNIHLTMRSVVPWPHRRIAWRDAAPAAAVKVSVLHPWRSLKSLVGQRIPVARLGWSSALGVFLGTLPLIGFHSIAILFAAGYFRLSKVAALGASQLCMPPIVPALCIEVGYYLRHGAFLTEVSLRTLGYEALDRLLEWLIGSLVLAPALAVVSGGAVYLAARHIARRTAPGARAPADEPVN